MKKRLLLLTLPTLLVACSTVPVPERTIVESPPPDEPQQMEFALASGSYHCNAGEVVKVMRDRKDGNHINVSWKGRSHDLQRNPSASGLPRYEHPASPLVWIDLPWKSYLLDQESGKPLASECRAG
ncbi:MliC family protein [Nitrogeniibacter aestuarii]|uniref:MliC family protein n=1 Tax=Nitrogeniibacter aestuarii TaxID=2815343 RepID=UPI001D1145CB|nr:MliC family protein [Nitrogeniibacter aestuarii]